MPESLFLIKLQAPPPTLLKKETVAQVFSSEFCEISKKPFSYRTPSVAASVTSDYSCCSSVCYSYYSILMQSFYARKPRVNRIFLSYI